MSGELPVNPFPVDSSAGQQMMHILEEIEHEMRGVDCETDGQRYGDHEELIQNTEAELDRMINSQQEMKEELDGCRKHAKQILQQLETYKSKYLLTSKLANQQSLQLDKLKSDSNASEQVNQKLSDVKKVFEEKMEEIIPLQNYIQNSQTECEQVVAATQELKQTKENLSSYLLESQEREQKLRREVEEYKKKREKLDFRKKKYTTD